MVPRASIEKSHLQHMPRTQTTRRVIAVALVVLAILLWTALIVVAAAGSDIWGSETDPGADLAMFGLRIMYVILWLVGVVSLGCAVLILWLVRRRGQR